MRNAVTIRVTAAGLLICALIGLAPWALAEAVSRNEAVAVAAMWLQMEVDGPHSRLDDAGKIQWRERLAHPRVYYLLAGDVLGDKVAKGDQVLAYIVAYQPGGFAVVTGDDRLDPFPVFDAYSRFRGDRVPENFLRKYLARNIPDRWAYLRTRLEAGEVEVHPEWIRLRRLLLAPDLPARNPSPGRLGGDTYIWWETALWGQRWPYNTLVVAENGGNNCPTGCTATAMAIQMRFFSWPPVGNSSHGYDDEWGDIQYHHGASFGSTTYEWVDMPTWDLTEENDDVAKLMYHCGVAVEMDYELEGSGAWPSSAAMNTYFRYRGTEDLWSETPSDHVEGMASSILAGLPVVLSTTSHTVLACGYQDFTPDDRWYLNVGWNGSNNGWYDLHQIPGSDPLIDMSCPHSSPNNYVFVDGGWNGPENGNHHFPYNTVSEGNAAVPAGGRLCMRRGSYTGRGNVPVTLSTPMRVTSYEGTARIGGS